MYSVTGDLRVLADPKVLFAKRDLAERKFSNLSSETISTFRKRAKKDPFFLAGVLGKDKLTEKLHGHFCMWLRRTQDANYRLVLFPRDHYKTTICTVTDSVRLALPDDEGDSIYPANLGTGIRILIAHEAHHFASRILFQIQKAFLDAPMMLVLFPECIPSHRKQRINNNELELPRADAFGEPTFDTMGTGGKSQGRHYNFLKLDDLIGEDARESPLVAKRASDWFDNIMSLLIQPKVDKWDLIGTHWGPGDLYAHAMNKYDLCKERSVLIRQNLYEDNPYGLVAYIRGAEENGLPIFPELMDEKQFSLLKKNMKVWSAQYANDPLLSGAAEFEQSWLKYYNVAGNDLVIFSGSASEKVRTWSLDRTILVDPSMGEKDRSDHTGIVVTGTDDKERTFILETVKKRLKPPDLIKLLFELNAKWLPRVISIEKVAFSGMFKDWIERDAREQKIHIPVQSYPPEYARGDFNRRNKESRIRGLQNNFAAGQIYMLEGMTELREEYSYFPIGSTHPGDHLLDALAQGLLVWRKGYQKSDTEKYRKAEEELLACRDALTGY